MPKKKPEAPASAPKTKPATERTSPEGVPARAPAKKRVGLRQLRIESEGTPHHAAMNSEGVWLKPINGKKGKNNPWHFLAWDDIAKAASTTTYAPTGDEE